MDWVSHSVRVLYDNTCWFYVGCVAVSILMAVFTHYWSSSLFAADDCKNMSTLEKRRKLKETEESIRKTMTKTQRNEEERIETKQLSEIYTFLQDDKEKYGIGSIEDMKEQLKLYKIT